VNTDDDIYASEMQFEFRRLIKRTNWNDFNDGRSINTFAAKQLTCIPWRFRNMNTRDRADIPATAKISHPFQHTLEDAISS
jgi:hypothetical protein